MFSYRSEDECVKDYRDRDRDYERDREYERAQREKLRRQEEERRRQKERFEKEKVFRRKEEEVKKERDLLREKGKKSDLTDFTSSTDKSEKVTKDDKKEDTIKRDRIRNKVLDFFKFMCLIHMDQFVGFRVKALQGESCVVSLLKVLPVLVTNSAIARKFACLSAKLCLNSLSLCRN